VNRHNLYNADSPMGPSVSAYVTYQKREEAARAILMVNGATFDNRQLKYVIDMIATHKLTFF
jgi:hypothetical protein